MSDTHDERGGDETAAEVVGLLRSLPRTKITPENITQHMIDRWYREKGKYLEQISDLCDQIRDLSAQLTAATARAESATVLPERWRALIAERDAAVRRAEEAHSGVDRWLCYASELENKLGDERQRAEKAEARLAERQPIRAEWSTENALCDPGDDPISQEFARRRVAKYPNIHTAVLRRQLYAGPWVPADKACRSCGETEHVVGDPPLCSNCVVYSAASCTGLLAAPALAADTAKGAATNDGSGWTAEENAEFEQRYGVQAAMQLRAANDRVWRIVQELRQAAVDDGRDPYQDPMARRLSAALVGVENVCSALPESLKGPQTCYTRHVHDGLMHICALAAGHDTHMCAEGDRWTTNDDTTENDRG